MVSAHMIALLTDKGSPLFCMGNTMPPTSTEADHRRGVLNAEPPLLSKCPGFHHQYISLIGYLNPISPIQNSEEPRAILDTGINRDFRSLRLCVLASLRSQFNAKAQRRRDAKGDICRHVFRVVVHPTDTLQKSSVCGGAKYNHKIAQIFTRFLC